MKYISLLLLIFGLCTGPMYGAMLSAGTRQFAFDGRIDQTDGVNFSLGCDTGYFVSDQFEIGMLCNLEMTHGSDATTLGLGSFCEYNFILENSKEWVPFVGGTITFKYASYDLDYQPEPGQPNIYDQSTTALEFGGYTGIRYFILNNFAIGSAVRIFVATDDIYYSNNGDFDAFDWDVVLNTSFYF